MAGLVSFIYHLFTRQGDDQLRPTPTTPDITRIWGNATRELLKIFQKYEDGHDRLPRCKLRGACNELNLFPSYSQVNEMVQCAVEYGSPCEPEHITFGEFCILVTELQHYYSKSPKMPEPISLHKRRVDRTEGRRKRRVFLGGSCNPTTWRQEIAIPYFKQHGITFYNPQVQNWRPELMELEAQAKQLAEVLFFVIDNETRAVASMIETAFLVACQRQVVVVMRGYEDNVYGEINSEVLTARAGKTWLPGEIEDISRARMILTDLVERNGVPVFSSVEQAVKCTRYILKQGLKTQELTLANGAQPVKYGHFKVGEALLQLRESFNSVNNCKMETLGIDDISLAYKCCTGHDLDAEWLINTGKSQGPYTFEEFCCIVTEYQQRRASSWNNRFFKFVGSLRLAANRFTGSPTMDNSEEDRECRDVYLGGSCGDSHWREKITIPLLRKSGLSYMNPCVNDWEQRLIPIQVAARESCFFLLYVITSRTRSISSMIEAGYYIGKCCRLVLCIQKYPEETIIGGEKITKQGLLDYNRGRSYLSDLANRDGVPLFDDITEATNYVISARMSP